MEIQKEIFLKALGLSEPWYIKETKLDQEKNEFDVFIDFKKGATFYDEKTKKEYKAFATVEKTWKHLFMWQYVTYIHVRVPKIKDDNESVRMINFPLVRKGSTFTYLCEAFILEMAKQMPIYKIGEMLKANDGKIVRVINYYVEKSQKEASYSEVKKLALDETSRKKGHNYFSILSNLDTGRVLEITEGKKAETVEKLAKSFEKHHGKRENIEEVTIDFSPSFTAGVIKSFPNASIVYDHFHLMQMANNALDKIRRSESKANKTLKKSRYLWLKRPENLSEEKKQRLELLKMENKVLAEAYQMKENLALFYKQETIEKAEIYLKDWCDWVMEGSIFHMQAVAKTIKRHWKGVMNYMKSYSTNGIAESLNSVIQSVKRRGRGYRNTSNFKALIFLKLADFPIISKSVYLT